MKFSVATTTINVPILLEDYVKASLIFSKDTGHEVDFVVAGDRNTPKEAQDFCVGIQNKFGVKIKYLDVADQINLISGSRSFRTGIRWDCIQRRNFSGLYSSINGADYVIYIDDDNFIVSSHYFHDHLKSISTKIESVQSSDSGYINIISTANGERCSDGIYPRGFPFELRNSQPTIDTLSDGGEVAVNAGLWLNEPDIDAVTRIASRPIVESYALSRNDILSKGTWTPINSQNTLIKSPLLVSYFLSSEVGRYDDIYAGYVMQKIMQEMNYRVSYGNPIVKQNRNEHDLLQDLQHELEGMKNIDFICSFIRNLNLSGETVFGLMDSLLNSWETELLKINKKHPAFRELTVLLHGYSLWFDIITSVKDFFES